jgi:hypothetical protein
LLAIFIPRPLPFVSFPSSQQPGIRSTKGVLVSFHVFATLHLGDDEKVRKDDMRAIAEFQKKTGPASKEGSKAEASESLCLLLFSPVLSFFPMALHLYLHAMI